ncbi:MAG: TIGR01777 family oxidoreductase [Chryseobacterium sp.]|nr:TIGR01777 family oxidoreductase [Candidatus Chryseobacterium enterohippi]
MKIIIAGGTGFLGESLQHFFEAEKHEVFILTRHPKSPNEIFWDAKNIGEWSQTLENADVLIYLAGKSVDCRYTEKNKTEIYSSRIPSTQILQNAINLCKIKPKLWLNASSATIYIHSETQQNTEENGIIGDDFSMNICKSWEAEFFKQKDNFTRKVALRTSIVLGNEGGAFPKLKTVTKWGLGGKQGSGNQMVSWIHIEDFCRAISFIIYDESISGAINITAPNPISNHYLMKELRTKMNRSFGLDAAVWQLEMASIFLNTETELLMKSRNVVPEILIRKGFQFQYYSISSAISQLLQR